MSATLNIPDLIRIGTRKSKLARIQTDHFCYLLKATYPVLKEEGRIEIVPIATKGDHITDRPLAEIGGKGLFIKELEKALFEKKIDLAVHSMKDMETFIPEGLSIFSILKREKTNDCLVSEKSLSFDDLPRGAIIGTSSPRRHAQLRWNRPDVQIIPLRGNVTTRLEKLKTKEMDATLLAYAGLKRLGMEHVITEILPTDRFIPAGAQGAIAIEGRAEDVHLHELLAPLNHQPSMIEVTAERAMLERIGGSCHSAIAAHARYEESGLSLNGAIYAPDGSECFSHKATGDAKHPETLGQEVADILKKSAKHLLPS